MNNRFDILFFISKSKSLNIFYILTFSTQDLKVFGDTVIFTLQKLQGEFIIQGEKGSIYFAGDAGVEPNFEDVDTKYKNI